MGNVTTENFEAYFSEHRDEYNQKIQINEQSFQDRQLKVLSYGVAKFHENWEKEIVGDVCINVEYSSNYDYSKSSIQILAIFKDFKSFVIYQSYKDVDDVDSITVEAQLIDEAATIEIIAIGDKPSKIAVADRNMTVKRIKNDLYSIDYQSFEDRGFEFVSVGIKKDKVQRKYKTTVLAELSVISTDTFDEGMNPKVCIILYDYNGLIIDAGQTDVPYIRNGYQIRFAKVEFESSNEFYIKSVKVFMTDGVLVHTATKTETSFTPEKTEKPRNNRKKRLVSSGDTLKSQSDGPTDDELMAIDHEMAFDLDDDDFNLDDIDVPSFEEILDDTDVPSFEEIDLDEL